MKPLLLEVQSLYLQQFNRWFGIMAPTSVIATLVLVLADLRIRAMNAAIPRGTLQYHPVEMGEAVVLRLASFFVAWLLGCFALGAVATVAGNLDSANTDAPLRDSHQRSREHFGKIVLIAAATFAVFMAGMAACLFINIAFSKAIGWTRFARYNFAVMLAGYVIVASVTAWFGAAIPVVLRGNLGAWTALKKSWRASDGYELSLFILVVESVVGSYVIWYLARYALQLMAPSSIRHTVWYGWTALLLSVAASAAVEPPLFIGLTLLAQESPGKQVSDQSVLVPKG